MSVVTERKKIPKFYLEARAWKFALTPKKLEFPTKYNADWWFSQRQNLGLQESRQSEIQ